MIVVMAGATGLVGTHLLAQLVADTRVAQVITIGRRAPDLATGKVSNKIGPVADWMNLLAGVKTDVALCTLGTTMNQAGSREAFAAIDLDAVTAFATAARSAGARQFLMVSSVGANKASSNFYLQTKGKAEWAVCALGFDRVDVFRPGLLRGNRGGAVRFGERIGIAVSPITDLMTPRAFDKYRSISAVEVAGAMARATGAEGTGVIVHHNREMWG